MRDHKQLQTMEATILWKDDPIVAFKVDNGRVIYISPFYENENLFPLEFRGPRGITMDEINMFVDARIVPRERYDIHDLLKGMGLEEYRWEPILRYVHGLCTDDCYWFRFPGEKLKYNDVKIRD